MARSKTGDKKAAKKAARTRKRNKKSRDAKKAKAAGTISERRYASQLRGKITNPLILMQSGIPDIISYDNGWKFYEVKPYIYGSFSSETGRKAAPNRRLLNENQFPVFKKLVSKKFKLYMVYYYRKSHGRKNKPKYSFKYREVLLRKSDFKRRKNIDPVEFEVDGRFLDFRWYQ